MDTGSPVIVIVAGVLALILGPNPSWARQTAASGPQSQPAPQTKPAREGNPLFGGPDQVDKTIATDDETVSRITGNKFYDPWFEWKNGLQEKYGLAFSVDYSAAWFGVSDTPAEAEGQASSGMVRFYGAWDLVGRESGNTGAVVWKAEHRHEYGAIPLSTLGFNLGYAGLIEPPFSDQGLRWTNLYWRQRWSEGRWAAVAGFLDATDFVDVYALASPWTGFTNFAFSTGTTTIPVPNDATFGVGIGGMVTDTIFLIGSLVDRNADPTDPFKGFDTFFGTNEYFKTVEIGWTPSQDRIYLDNAHLTFWHADERKEAGEAEGWGLNVSFTRYLGQKWLPFVRAGYANDGASLMQKSVSVGFAYQPVPQSDVLGVGFNWGEPNADTFGPGLRDQYTTEVYYRWQLTPRFAVTPTLQFLANPALNPGLDRTWIFGIRARLAL